MPDFLSRCEDESRRAPDIRKPHDCLCTKTDQTPCACAMRGIAANPISRQRSPREVAIDAAVRRTIHPHALSWIADDFERHGPGMTEEIWRANIAAVRREHLKIIGGVAPL
jgi:hypothetical protein